MPAVAVAAAMAALLASAPIAPITPAAPAPAARPLHPAPPSPPAPARLRAPALRPAAVAREPEVAEPFFDFLLRMIAADSLGVWTQSDLRPNLLAGPRRTRIPLRHLRSLERTAVPGVGGSAAGAATGAAAVPVRRWKLVLSGPLELPMPYSILGYRPGKLLLSGVVEATELDLGGPNLRVPQGGRTVVVPVSDLRAIRIDSGWVALDVDGVVDRLLGARLDDSWLTGFVLCRAGGRLRGLGLARSREGRLLLGELDFAADEIEPQGDAVARALSLHVRPLIEREEDPSRWRVGG